MREFIRRGYIWKSGGYGIDQKSKQKHNGQLASSFFFLFFIELNWVKYFWQPRSDLFGHSLTLLNLLCTITVRGRNWCFSVILEHSSTFQLISAILAWHCLLFRKELFIIMYK